MADNLNTLIIFVAVLVLFMLLMLSFFKQSKSPSKNDGDFYMFGIEVCSGIAGRINKGVTVKAYEVTASYVEDCLVKYSEDDSERLSGVVEYNHLADCYENCMTVQEAIDKCYPIVYQKWFSHMSVL